jgi:uncharacterized protein (TIGR03790 family)
MRQGYRVFPAFVLSAILFMHVITGVTEGALAPEEIAVLVNINSPDSIRIGTLYTELRNVPPDQLIKVSVPAQEGVSRRHYEELIQEPVRKAVSELYKRGRKIRCILTTYGIPLKIGPVRSLIVPEEEINKYERMIKQKNEQHSVLNKKRKMGNHGDEDLNRAIHKLNSELGELNFKLKRLKGHDTVAAVDSELALLLVPDYPLAGWQHNPEFLHARGKIDYTGQVLMVSRLDGPTPELAEGLIRTAVKVERNGLYGTLYLDARGKTGKDPYGQFDEDIRRTAQILKQSPLPVVLDNLPDLFRPGEAPSAALYCGWYSLGEYRDAFQWVEGAVGYHVASAEAKSLHDPSRQYWVKSMIEKGVIATLGPVTEPYLSAFPPPSLFFPLLMSGRYALAEVFAMTNPLLSWRMILVGDPLYNPFRNRPAYSNRSLPLPPR